MALRNQPYLPLYIEDYLTDEKLNECSAASQGVFVKIMCVLHKQEKYGCLELKAKHKQNESKIKNFAFMLNKQLTFSEEIIYNALVELLDENVLIIEDEILYQKRMKRDGELSEIRANAGSNGGKSSKKTSKQNESKTLSKNEANTEYENKDVNEDNNDNKNINFIDQTKKNIKLPYKFSQISDELKNCSQTKIFCIQTYKVKEEDYDKYIDWFMGINCEHSDNEIVDFSEYRKHFKNWMKFNANKLTQFVSNSINKDILISEETKTELSKLYISKGIVSLFEKYIKLKNIDEKQGYKDFERAKKQNIDYLNLQSRIMSNEQIYNY